MNSSAAESSPASLLTEWCRLVVRQPLDTAVAQARGWFGFMVITQCHSLFSDFTAHLLKTHVMACHP
jgi:hypothetical protein